MDANDSGCLGFGGGYATSASQPAGSSQPCQEHLPITHGLPVSDVSYDPTFVSSIGHENFIYNTFTDTPRTPGLSVNGSWSDLQPRTSSQTPSIITTPPTNTVGSSPLSPIPLKPPVGNYFCADCPGFPAFEKRHEYNTHLKVHTRPHTCHLCGGSFRYKKDLTRHENSRHATAEDVKKFYCTIGGCTRAVGGRPFKRQDDCRKHERNHRKKSSR